jgi:hypothetical protein
MPEKWTWPEYRELNNAIYAFTGAKLDPAHKTLGEIFGLKERAAAKRKPVSVEEQQRIEAERRKAEEERRRRVTDYDLRRFLCSELSRSSDFRKLGMPEWELEWWEHRIGFTPESVAELTFPTLSEKKLENRIRRFEEAAERMSAFADRLEERLEEETTIRRIQ